METAFTEVADVSSARAYLSSAGTAGGNPGNTSIIFGGATTSSTCKFCSTEEWNAADFQIKSDNKLIMIYKQRKGGSNYGI